MLSPVWIPQDGFPGAAYRGRAGGGDRGAQDADVVRRGAGPDADADHRRQHATIGLFAEFHSHVGPVSRDAILLPALGGHRFAQRLKLDHEMGIGLDDG